MCDQSLEADVLIVGAGPAGAALAAMLAARGCAVLLLDRTVFPRDKTCGDGLTPRAIPVLERLGVLGKLHAAGYQRILGARLYPAHAEPWTFAFAEHPVGLPPYGLVAPRFELDQILLENALANGAHFIPGFHAIAPLRPGAGAVTGVTGTLDGRAARACARLTVLAVGANIGLLRAFDLLRQMPPGINAIRGYFEGVPDLQPFFEFYFEPGLAPGYGWVFPVGEGRANVGLGVAGRKGQSRNLRQLLNEFVARWPRLREGRPAGPAKGFPLRTDFPGIRPGGRGFLLVGEALGLVNPVTGEGIDLALESAELAAPLITSALSGGMGSSALLAAYEAGLMRRYAGFFRGARVLLRLAMHPGAIRVLTQQAKKKPRLARLIAGINLGVASPWQAFSPLTWWDILS